MALKEVVEGVAGGPVEEVAGVLDVGGGQGFGGTHDVEDFVGERGMVEAEASDFADVAAVGEHRGVFRDASAVFVGERVLVHDPSDAKGGDGEVVFAGVLFGDDFLEGLGEAVDAFGFGRGGVGDVFAVFSFAVGDGGAGGGDDDDAFDAVFDSGVEEIGGAFDVDVEGESGRQVGIGISRGHVGDDDGVPPPHAFGGAADGVEVGNVGGEGFVFGREGGDVHEAEGVFGAFEGENEAADEVAGGAGDKDVHR